MNDLIKEFARQSGFKVNFQHEDHQAIRMAQYREFAELIIDESIKVMMANDYHGEWLGKKIKEHFGVEE